MSETAAAFYRNRFDVTFGKAQLHEKGRFFHQDDISFNKYKILNPDHRGMCSVGALFHL